MNNILLKIMRKKPNILLFGFLLNSMIGAMDKEYSATIGKEYMFAVPPGGKAAAYPVYIFSKKQEKEIYKGWRAFTEPVTSIKWDTTHKNILHVKLGEKELTIDANDI